MTTFFFDNHLSPHFAHMFKALGIDVRALRDEFLANTDDVVWIPEIGRRGWVLITYDRGIATNAVEARALKHNNVTTIFLGRFWRNLRRWDQVVWLVRNWPKITEFVETNPQGTIAQFPQKGRPRYIVL